VTRRGVSDADLAAFESSLPGTVSAWPARTARTCGTLHLPPRANRMSRLSLLRRGMSRVSLLRNSIVFGDHATTHIHRRAVPHRACSVRIGAARGHVPWYAAAPGHVSAGGVSRVRRSWRPSLVSDSPGNECGASAVEPAWARWTEPLLVSVQTAQSHWWRVDHRSVFWRVQSALVFGTTVARRKRPGRRWDMAPALHATQFIHSHESGAFQVQCGAICALSAAL